MWMIPVLGRGTSDEYLTTPVQIGYPSTCSLHVDWNLEPFPAGVELEGGRIDGNAQFGPSSVGPVLGEAYGRWNWKTILCDQGVAAGGQLTVSIPFSRYFDIYGTVANPIPHVTKAYRRIEAWIKYRPLSGAGEGLTLSSIRMALSDAAGSNPIIFDRQYIDSVNFGAWNIAYFYHLATVFDDQRLDNRNLRINAVFQGPITGILPVSTLLDIEWFAIGLSDEYTIEDD